MENRQWEGTTYGGETAHRWLISVLRHVDIRLIYLFAEIFVVPVCLVLNPSRKTAYDYFRNRLGYGRWRAAWSTYINHCKFAQVVVDKFAMYAGKRFEVDIEGFDKFENLASRPEGFLHFSSHVGNYEIAGYTLVAEEKPFNALVFFGEKETVMESRKHMFADTNIKMIPVSDDMSHLFAINQVLDNGETLSMPADRIFGSQKSVSVSFLGAPAEFPLGPFTVATMRGLDALAVNVMKTSSKGYKIYVTPLSYDKEAPRKQQIAELVQSYVRELERMVRLYPTQWYNFYEFWK